MTTFFNTAKELAKKAWAFVKGFVAGGTAKIVIELVGAAVTLGVSVAMMVKVYRDRAKAARMMGNPEEATSPIEAGLGVPHTAGESRLKRLPEIVPNSPPTARTSSRIQQKSSFDKDMVKKQKAYKRLSKEDRKRMLEILELCEGSTAPLDVRMDDLSYDDIHTIPEEIMNARIRAEVRRALPIFDKQFTDEIEARKVRAANCPPKPAFGTDGHELVDIFRYGMHLNTLD